jgi:hypothetical protein
MKRFALLVVVFVSLASYQQEVKHAPTVEQCRAAEIRSSIFSMIFSAH